ncbi:pyruvate dehydrogenase [acetyl-transferring]-phosphatase 2, mitochondrial [Gadus macrocephalus]|uniref:pyruvate dehydrogenase [acetyl-transferring]-phosphatase 2, mitochondrial n=1 Tax=Gadus macrocephalus TaxID=80720 RepID=UPI0028CB76B1|nr:pyruvate dehydrogenase [acetyl-transferring]-phosphatase 2, mitochondrial [Gadus macrocephalus]
MSGLMCSRILQKAASCTLSFSCSASLQWMQIGGRSTAGALGGRCLSTRQNMDFQLNQIQVNSILQANEQAVSIPWFDGRSLSAVRKFESNHLAANTPNEDRHGAATCLQTPGTLFGVFDGHGGWACAQAVSERLLSYVAIAMMSLRSLEELEWLMEQGRPVPAVLQWYKHRGDVSYQKSASFYREQLRVFWQELLDHGEHSDGMSPAEAMDYAFKRLDTDISLEAQVPLSSDLLKSTAIQVAFTGCTACVAHLDLEGIHVANAGDCRAVLGVQEDDGSWTALPLSRDHNAQNPAELQRVRARHPPSETATVVSEDRLLGVLMPLRAFGDVSFKWSRELQSSVLQTLESGVDLDSLNMYHHTPPNYLTPPYLDAAPEVLYHKLRPQDRFLILGSDGLWDEMGSQQAVQLVGEHLSGVHLQAPVSDQGLKLGQMQDLLQRRSARATRPSDLNAATHLIRHALGTSDRGQLCPERLAAMLALPEELARMYRDDVTATVVYLNSDLSKPQKS